MAKMTKAQAKRRLVEAERKFMSVYTKYRGSNIISCVHTKDMEAIEKIVSRCLNRIK